ncbi:hypothetical protein D9M68_794980 [compost metagenome]
MPPERTCASMSVSPPSWLFGKILISTRPLVSLAMRSAASCARMFSGWLSGRLLPYLYENSAARAMRGTADTMPAAGRAESVRKAPRRFRRVSEVMSFVSRIFGMRLMQSDASADSGHSEDKRMHHPGQT